MIDFFFQAEDGIRDYKVTGVQTCALPISVRIDFTGCTFTGDAHSVTLSGSIDIVDPTPAITDRAFRTRSNAFTRTVTNAATGTTRSVVENGVRSVVGTSDQIQLPATMQTDYTYATGA